MSATLETMKEPRVVLNEQRLIGAVEMDLYQLIHKTHVQAVTITAQPFDWFWSIQIKVDLFDKHEIFPVDVHSDTTYESLALAISFEADNINRWIDKNI